MNKDFDKWVAEQEKEADRGMSGVDTWENPAAMYPEVAKFWCSRLVALVKQESEELAGGDMMDQFWKGHAFDKIVSKFGLDSQPD